MEERHEKKIVWLLCSALLLTILSACGGNDDAPKGRGNNVPTSVSSAVTAPVRSTTLAVTVANVSGYNFQELYVSPTGTNNWGEDHLGSTSILKNNGSYDITLARYDFENYDVLIIDEDGDEYEFKYVPLVDGCEMQIGFEKTVIPGDGCRRRRRHGELSVRRLNGSSERLEAAKQLSFRNSNRL